VGTRFSGEGTSTNKGRLVDGFAVPWGRCHAAIADIEAFNDGEAKGF
jgi:hypothetical protein